MVDRPRNILGFRSEYANLIQFMSKIECSISVRSQTAAERESSMTIILVPFVQTMWKNMFSVLPHHWLTDIPLIQ
jgi:hypothetical protein